MKARKIELREVGAETCQYRVSFRGTFRQLVSSKRFVERVDREARAIRPAVDAQDGADSRFESAFLPPLAFQWTEEEERETRKDDSRDCIVLVV